MNNQEFMRLVTGDNVGFWLLCGNDTETLSWFRSLRTPAIVRTCWNEIYPTEMESIVNMVVKDSESHTRIVITNNPDFMHYIRHELAINRFFVAMKGREISKLFDREEKIKLLDILSPGEAFLNIAHGYV